MQLDGGFLILHFFQLQWSSQKQVLGHITSPQPWVPTGQPSDGLSVAISNFIEMSEYTNLDVPRYCCSKHFDWDWITCFFVVAITYVIFYFASNITKKKDINKTMRIKNALAERVMRAFFFGFIICFKLLRPRNFTFLLTKFEVICSVEKYPVVLLIVILDFLHNLAFMQLDTVKIPTWNCVSVFV